jgi:branched-chain amino acid transport system substrate-binding protein
VQLTRRSLVRTVAGAAALTPAARSSYAQQTPGANTIRIGLLSDMSGPYRDISGPNGVACARQAVQDFGSRGFSVDVVFADHQNRPDVASNIARQWFDRDGVDAVVEVVSSAPALAVNGIAREKNKVVIHNSAAVAELTGAQCTPNTVHWSHDTWMLSRSTGGAMVQAGGDSWFFVTADYAFGHALERDTARFVREQGGRILGSARHPFPSADFSSYLLQAQASRARVIGLANTGTDVVTSIKQAAEFGITRRGTKIAVLLIFITDVHALGLQQAQGLVLSESFYWDLNERTRAFTNRVRGAMGGAAPSMSQAGCYAGTLHYLKAVADMGVEAAKASGRDAVARMKSIPTDDDAFGHGRIREDGRKLHPAYLFEVKSPEESRGPWDYYKLLQTTSAEQAFRPLSEGGCPLIRG